MLKLLRLLVAGGVAVAALWLALVLAVYAFGARDEARQADAIVVLGAAQYDGRPSPVLQARLDHAIELYRAGRAPLLVLTGGVGIGDTVSEAVVGRRYAVKAGVPPEAILTERSGLNSGQSLGAVEEMLAKRSRHTALLVSDPFHMLRLRLMAMRMGMEVYSSPTRSSPISEDRRAELRHVLRETVSIPASLLSDPARTRVEQSVRGL